jgi:hypothetical protein
MVLARLLQPDTGTISILLHEDHPGSLQGFPNRRDGRSMCNQLTRLRFEPFYCREGHARTFGKVFLLDAKKRPRRSDLFACQIADPPDREPQRLI